VSHKTGKITAAIRHLQGHPKWDARYLGYFECFNRQQFYEAHDVLEDLWLGDRKGTKGKFYKGLIQLAGAFVHLQKERLRPAAALFRLASANLEAYPSICEGLELRAVITLIAGWHNDLASTDFQSNPLKTNPPPSLHLLGA
jgi:predicted metal-dependent hydrolase